MDVVVPLVNEGLGNSSYVVDLGDGGALIVDPERDHRRVLAELDRRALAPRFVVETHLHADFVSGARELAAHGAELLAPAEAALAFPHRALRHGEELPLGGLTLRAIATPGHTPEHLAYLLSDGAQPLALFSGGTLIAGGAARPDLLSPEQTEPLARAAYRSVRERLFTLPDELPVFPTHGGGSFCSTGAAADRTTTIGRERTANPLFRDADEDASVARLLAGLGSYPPYFLELRGVNQQGPAVVGAEPPALPALDLAAFDAAVAGGAEVVDVRGVPAFAAGHLPGSLSLPWREQFAPWLGWLVPRDRPVVFVADESVDRRDLVWAALTIGFPAPAGELAGGLAAWRAAGRALSTTPVLDRSAANGRHVVDVRQHAEFTVAHAPGAVHLELGALPGRVGELPDGPLLVHCGHGERAMTAASLMERAGRTDVAVFPGGPAGLLRPPGLA